tara:strand:- start:1335 stop:2042 length:708 start_codon:yes stop_codon:yes gene_type:complete
MQKILTNPQANAKINKSIKKGFFTFGIHLAPFNLSGFNVCAWASNGCANACLNTAGRGRMTAIQESRIKKTKWFYNDKENFMLQLVKEISNAIKFSIKKSQTPCFRLNLTSDLAWESQKSNGVKLMELFPNVQFYDYTKSVKRMEKFLSGKFPSNYHLTFSRSESNQDEVEKILSLGGNVACVFRNALPKTWNGYEVINGDENDLRFLDKQNVIVGLVEKGLAKKDKTGFVLECS